MEGIKLVVFAFILCGFQLYNVRCETCTTVTKLTGKIVATTSNNNREECWTIEVPSGHFIHVQKINIHKSGLQCEHNYLRMKIAGTNDVYQFCSLDSGHNPVTAFDSVKVSHYVPSNYNYYTTGFSLEYTIKSVECLNSDSFKCDSNTCLSQDKVCNGVKDCSDGKDEVGCVTGELTIEGVIEARQKAISWLEQERTVTWGWKENTPRAVVALYLSSASSFNGTDLEEELMAKEAEIKAAVALLRSSLTSSEISMFINALLVTCHSPRQFYGNNLVKRLKDQMESEKSTHPVAYLALCNANEAWPQRSSSDLNSILSSTSEYPFVRDLQAMAVTAISCEANRSRSHEKKTLKPDTLKLYNQTILQFKKLQADDGSFGNVYTTALITQALFSSGQGHIEDWNLNATIEFLVKELNSSSVDFLTTYLTLPILNGKSLVDISHGNCSKNPRKHGDDPVEEISDYLGEKIRVQYSLYVGDEKDVVHTIALRVPQNYSAFEVMELAAVEDPKYKFEWKKTSGKIYVYEIDNITNDPESGKFWLLHVGTANSSEALTPFSEAPNKVIMDDGEHLVLWYKTAMF